MKKAAVILIFIYSFLLTGCWNAREINELGFVLSIGLDKNDEGFKVTAQMASPETFSKTPSGSGSPEISKPFWIVKSSGKTIFEAIRNMASISSRRIFWAHIKVIIISEELARSNTLEVFDFFTRNPELRLRTLIAVTPGEAEKLIEIIPEMEKDPALYLEKIIENKSLTGKSYSIMLKDFLQDYLDPNIGPVTSRIIIDKSEGKPVLKTSGAYVFDDSKVSASLNEGETRGLLWIKNKMKDSIMVVYCPEDNKPVTLEIKGSKSSFKSSVDDGIPHFEIKIDVKASITEQSCQTDFNDSQKLNELSKVLETAVYRDIQSVITAAKYLKIDFLGFSTVLNRQHRKEFHQLPSKWDDIFSDSEVIITVNADIQHVSLAKPLEPIKKQK